MRVDEIVNDILGLCTRILELLCEDVILHCTTESALEGVGIVA